MVLVIEIFLVVILAICVITDVKSRKIYNKVVYPCLIAVFIYHFSSGGLEALIHSFLGFLIGLALLLLPYILGGMGAGDVKLLGLIGAFKGGAFVFQSFLYIALIGGVIAVGIIIFRSGVLKSFFYFLYSLKNGVRDTSIVSKGSLTATYPYGVPIAAGVVLSIVADKGFFL
ncbi:A24 family peptidase [Salipaludibacillus sp. CF4.18]|uniref:A24 family peptidase n=1 Tax=Salipaludibacillus sp. CF4.18 TaxID=3373081 RepID=UPI003EE5DB92